MITAYFLIAVFALGWLSGSIVTSGEKPGLEHWAWLVVLCLFWPVMGYFYWLDWRNGE